METGAQTLDSWRRAEVISRRGGVGSQMPGRVGVKGESGWDGGMVVDKGDGRSGECGGNGKKGRWC